MATGLPAVVQRFFSRMGAGISSVAPPNSLDPEAGLPFVWRDGLNMIERDGVLAPRPCLALPNSTQPPYQLSATLSDAEVPVHIIQGAAGLVVVVTDRQLFVRTPDFGWKNITPTYAVGSVTATNGSQGITGAGGTLWLTRKISPRHHILIDGRYYQINAVGAEDDITLSEPFAGTTGAGKAYSILRNFPGRAPEVGFTNLIYAVLYNEALYVAGTYLGKAFPGASPAVIKVTNLYTSSPTVSYLTATEALTAGLDTIPSLTSISGIRVLQDGRVVITGNNSTVFYSSHLNDTVWTVAPAGEVDVTLLSGKINALGNRGTSLTLHYTNGIVYAHPTNLSDPPLSFEISGAHVGCYGSRTLRSDGAREFFLGSDGQPYLFDGSRCHPLAGDELRARLHAAGIRRNDLLYKVHAGIDRGRGQYLVAFEATPDTKLWVCDDLDQGGRIWPWLVGAPISAIGEMAEDDYAGYITIDFAVRPLIGTWGLDGAVETPNILRFLDEDATSDAVYTGGATFSCFVESDDLDFGFPLNYKTIEKVVLWGRGVGTVGTDAPVVSISRDGGQTWVAKTLGVPLSANVREQRVRQASFLGEVKGGHMLRAKLAWNANPGTRPTRLLVVSHLGGSLEQVELKATA